MRECVLPLHFYSCTKLRVGLTIEILWTTDLYENTKWNYYEFIMNAVFVQCKLFLYNAMWVFFFLPLSSEPSCRKLIMTHASCLWPEQHTEQWRSADQESDWMLSSAARDLGRYLHFSTHARIYPPRTPSNEVLRPPPPPFTYRIHYWHVYIMAPIVHGETQ